MRYTVLLFLIACLPAHASLQVFACEPEWAALTRAVAGDRAEVHTAIAPDQDAHQVQARPSLISRVRSADLVICTGAGLEAGWLPLLLDRARNPAVRQPPGLFLATNQVTLKEVPETVDRSDGDIHAAGNPHVHLDPERMASIARALGARLARLDEKHARQYETHAESLAGELETLASELREQGRTLRGQAVVVHHRDWRYLLDWLGLSRAAELEPQPGVPPTPGHLGSLVDRVAERDAQLILYRKVNGDRAARWLAKRTPACAVELPYTVGEQGTSDLSGFYQQLVNQLVQSLEGCHDST
jgi:zinc/manganese transport system substrate-binding protein